MKLFPSLMLAAFVVAAPLLSGCGEESGPPKADTTSTIQSGNNPKEQPGSFRKPGQPAGTVEGGGKAPAANAPGEKPAENAPAAGNAPAKK
jgi:hypothetical protein